MNWSSKILNYLFFLTLCLLLILTGCATSTSKPAQSIINDLSRKEKRAAYLSLIHSQQYEKAALLLESEVKALKYSKPSSFASHVLHDVLTDIYAFKLLNFGKAFDHNNRFYEAVSHQNLQSEITEVQSQSLVEKYHFRQLYLFQLTFDQAGIDNYVGDPSLHPFYRKYIQANRSDRGELPKATDSWSRMLQETNNFYESGEYQVCIQTFEELLNKIKRYDQQKWRNALLKKYQVVREKEAHRKKLFEAAIASTLMAGLGGIQSPLYFLFSLGGYSNVAYQTIEGRRNYKRSMLLSFEPEVGKYLNYLLSPIDQIDLYYRIAESYENIDRIDDAIYYYKAGITVLEELRSTIRRDRQKIQFFTQQMSLYHRLVDLLIQTSSIEDAFFYIDRFKSRSLVDLVASRALADRKSDLVHVERERRAKIRCLMDQVQISDAQTRGIELATPEMTGTRRNQLRSLLSVEMMNRRELEQIITDQTVIQFLYTNKRVISVAFNRQHGFFHSVTKVPSASYIDDLAESIISEITSTKTNFTTLNHFRDELYKVLFGKLDDKFTRKIIIIPQGRLYQVPFNALTRNGSPLIRNHQITTLPSIALAKYLRKPKTYDSVFLIGNIAYTAYPSLQFTETEIQNISNTFSGQADLLMGNCTKTTFLERVKRYDVIHFAGHAFYNTQKPMESGLIFSDTGKDYVLTAYELLSINLDCKLMTLSACETGKTGSFREVEIMGLSRALFFAGVQSMMISLWKVDDRSTMEFMSQFYTYLKSNSSAEALRLTQLKMMERYQNPLYWAPFYISGLN